MMGDPADAPELEHLFQSDTEEPIVVNPAPPTAQRRVRFTNAPSVNQRIFNERKYHRLTVEHINAKKLSYYTSDIFHTLVNMRTYRFLTFFMACYMSMYAIFAVFYRMQREECIFNVHNYFHALWFSVITSATIGYGYQAPDPDCYIANLIVMFQVMTGALMQAALLGLVYSRFAAPGSRAHTIKFSNIMTCFKGPDGFWRLAFRVANMRHHQVLHPEVQLLMIRREHVGGPSGPLEYRYHELPVTHISGRKTIWLGVPSIVIHKINQKSPLWGLTPEQMEENEGCEFVALLDGVDETTSTVMQARHSYAPSDIRWGQSFAGVLARGGSGALTADYSNFDLTRMEVPDDAVSVDWSQRSGASGTSSVLPSIYKYDNVSDSMAGRSDSGASEVAAAAAAPPLIDLEAGQVKIDVVLPEENSTTEEDEDDEEERGNGGGSEAV